MKKRIKKVARPNPFEETMAIWKETKRRLGKMSEEVFLDHCDDLKVSDIEFGMLGTVFLSEKAKKE